MNQLKIKKLSDKVVLPSFATAGAAGMDLRAHLTEGNIAIQPGQRAVIGTGLVIELPDGREGQVRSRSGLAAKNGVVVLNSPGTIDSDYRGEVKVILYNTGNEAFWVKNGDRIAQLVIKPVEQVEIIDADAVTDTERGEGGLGSTGVE